MTAPAGPLTPEQLKARERWQSIWNLPIFVAAVVPLFITSSKTKWVETAVGFGSWLVFAVDLVVQLRIDRAYLRRRNGKIDLGIVVLTLPYYLIPGIAGGSAILLLARLARVVRLLLATTGMRRFAARLGKVAIVAAVVVLLASLGAYQAEHKTNTEFATVGDALWWGIVTLTTVGYGDIVPKTTAGRFCGVAIMFTGIAVLGVLAGSLASLFNLEPTFADQPADEAAPAAPMALPAELAMLQAQLREVERRLGELAERISARRADPGLPRWRGAELPLLVSPPSPPARRGSKHHCPATNPPVQPLSIGRTVAGDNANKGHCRSGAHAAVSLKLSLSAQSSHAAAAPTGVNRQRRTSSAETCSVATMGMRGAPTPTLPCAASGTVGRPVGRPARAVAFVAITRALASHSGELCSVLAAVLGLMLRGVRDAAAAQADVSSVGAGLAGRAPAKNMAWVPGGEFLMGSDDFYPEERPVHRVTVDGFWMDEHPVTVAEFRRFVKATGRVTWAERAPDPNDYPDADPELLVPGSLVFQPTSGPVDLAEYRNWWAWTPGAQWRHPEGPGSTVHGRELHPVTHVAYEDAVAYAAWAGKQLPTEAQWERAARGGLEGKVFCWGDEFAPRGRMMANTWQGEFPWQNLLLDRYERTSPVKQFPPNGYGLCDMAGNVWEWTSDFFTPRHPDAISHPCCSPLNPRVTSPEHGYDRNAPRADIPRRVTKGGSHLCAPNYCLRYRPAARQGEAVDTTTSHIGFRCVIA